MTQGSSRIIDYLEESGQLDNTLVLYAHVACRCRRVVNGVEQHPLSGVSMRYSFDEADAPTRKETQYYEMLGQRGIWHQCWKAVAEHGPISGMSNLDKDRWQLFHTDEDRSEMHDLSDQHPAKVRELVDLWMREAEANNVLPLNDMHVTGRDPLPTFMKLMFQVPVPHSGRYVYYPGTSPIPEKNAANTHAVSFKILAEVVIEAGTQGVIFAQGSHFGHALYVKDGKVSYVHSFLGIPPMQVLETALPAAGRHIIGVEFAKERSGQYNEAHGTATLYVGETACDTGEMRTVAGSYALCGEGLCIGYDGSDSVTTDYSGRFDYTGGVIVKVVFDVADDAYIDVERHLAAAISRD